MNSSINLRMKSSSIWTLLMATLALINTGNREVNVSFRQSWIASKNMLFFKITKEWSPLNTHESRISFEEVRYNLCTMTISARSGGCWDCNPVSGMRTGWLYNLSKVTISDRYTGTCMSHWVISEICDIWFAVWSPQELRTPEDCRGRPLANQITLPIDYI